MTFTKCKLITKSTPTMIYIKIQIFPNNRSNMAHIITHTQKNRPLYFCIIRTIKKQSQICEKTVLLFLMSFTVFRP